MYRVHTRTSGLDKDLVMSLDSTMVRFFHIILLFQIRGMALKQATLRGSHPFNVSRLSLHHCGIRESVSQELR
jgi:hypothetical protein